MDDAKRERGIEQPLLVAHLVESDIRKENVDAMKKGSVVDVRVDDREGIITIDLGIMSIGKEPPLYMMFVPVIKELMKEKYEKQFTGYKVRFNHIYS